MVSSIVSVFVAPFFGSLLGLLIDRLTSGGPIFLGRLICSSCGQGLAVAAMIPMIGSWLRSNRCAFCGAKRRRLYPLIELTCLAVALSAASYLSGWVLWASLYLGWSLVALAVIDAQHEILPDAINLPLIPAGLIVVGLLSPNQVVNHAIGAAFGFLVLAGVARIYTFLFKREGLGLGDAKLFAAAGAWLGWPALPGVLLMASVLALTAMLIRSIVSNGLTARDKIAFGPYLAIALWIGWLLGPLVLWQ